MRIYEPDEESLRWGNRVVVLCSEVADNDGPGVTEAAEAIRRSDVGAFELDDPLWIEHHGPESTDESTETFEWVCFSAFGKPVWEPLDRKTVERLLGGTV